MGRLLGFLLFWVGIGILLGILIPNAFCAVILALLLLLIGYNLFCSCYRKTNKTNNIFCWFC